MTTMPNEIESLRLGSVLNVGDSWRLLVLQWFGAYAKPLLIVSSPDLDIIAANEPAGQLLRSRHWLIEKDGQLGFPDPAALERFRAFLAGNATESGAWALKERGGDRSMILKTHRLAATDGRATLVIVVNFSDQAEDHHWADLGPVFGLTPAEDRLAKMMTDGQSVEELAHELSISVETARTHIRRIYLKVGVGSREQLSAALHPFRVD